VYGVILGILEAIIREYFKRAYEPVRQQFQDEMNQIQEMREQASRAWSNCIRIHVQKQRNNSLVPYDKSIAKAQIKRNVAHKNPKFNRRVQTKRVQTHTRK